MARSPSGFLIFLFLLLSTFLALATTPYYETSPHPYCDRPCQSEISLHFYLHQFLAGANHPNRNEEFVIASSYPFGFGTTLIHDWTLTESINPSDTIVARAQGPHIQAGRASGNSWYISQNIVFETGKFAGSTLQVMGTLAVNIDGQWSVIGGTGEFTRAQGTIKYKTDPSSNSEDTIRELDIHVIYTPNSPQAAKSGTGIVPNPLGGCNVIDRCCCQP